MSRTCLIALALLVASTAHGQEVIFQEDFESGLGQWVGQGNGDHCAAIVEDPLDPSNSAVNFRCIDVCGNIFSSEFYIADDRNYLIMIDYLGLTRSGSPATGYGGAVGLSNDLGCGNLWIAVTHHYDSVDLIDDDTWHRYYIPLDPVDLDAFGLLNTNVRLTLEDWQSGGSGMDPGVPRDAFFDNITVIEYDPVYTRATCWGGLKAVYK